MIEELKNIYEGKALLIKNNNYLTTKQYVEPFIRRMDTFGSTYRCQVKIPEQVSLTNGQQDIVFPRVHVQAILPKSFFYEENCQKVIGLIYGLDIKIPIAKFYIGNLNEDGNLVAFDKDFLLLQKLEDSTAIDYSPIISLMEKTDNTVEAIKSLKQEIIDRHELMPKLGYWVDYSIDNTFVNECGKIKLATSLPIDVYKALIKDKDSPHYVPETSSITYWDIYKTFVNLLNKDDKDIINRFEKTILISKLLKV